MWMLLTNLALTYPLAYDHANINKGVIINE